MTSWGTRPAASPAACRASVARYGQSREKRRVRGEPAGHELREEPHASRLARLAQREKIPRGKMGRPEEIATAALFLASDDSRFVNGVALSVDGGLSAI